MPSLRIALALIGPLAGFAQEPVWGQTAQHLTGDESSCAGLSPDSFEPNNTCVDAAPLGRGLFPHLNVSETNWDTFVVVVPHGFRLTVQEHLDVLDRVSYVYSEPGCGPYLTSGMQGLSWRNDSGRVMAGVLEVRRLPHAQVACSEYSMEIEVEPDPCFVAADDRYEPNDHCAGALWVSDGTYPEQWVSLYNRDLFRFCVPEGQTVSMAVLFDNTRGDLDAFLRPASAGTCGSGFGGDVLAQGTSGTHHEFLDWTNTTGSSMDVVLEVSVWDQSTQACNQYDLVVAGTGSCADHWVGSPFCDPMEPNSSGLATQLRGHFGSGSGSGLRLIASDGPALQFGYILVGSGTQEPGVAVGQGRLCLATQFPALLGRYTVLQDLRNSIGIFNAAGVWINQAGTSAQGVGFDVPLRLPIDGAGGIQAGQTWHFQLWHRDWGGEANFSNGLTVAF